MRALVAAAFFSLFVSCAPKENKPFWIYTGFYDNATNDLQPLVQKLTDRPIKWFSAGSEAIVDVLNAEQRNGVHRADLLLLGDPFIYFQLKKENQLLSYESPLSKEISTEFKDPDHYFAAVRFISVAIGYNRKILHGKPPASWNELLQPQWRDKVTMGDPRESGSGFTSAVLVSNTLGHDYFQKLIANHLLAMNKSSSVVTRVELGQKPVGILLLEDILLARINGAPIEPIYPKEGVVVYPGFVAIMRSTSDNALAKKIYDWFYSREAQEILVRHGMHSPFSSISTPEGGITLNELLAKRLNLPFKRLQELAEHRDEEEESIRTTFSHSSGF